MLVEHGSHHVVVEAEEKIATELAQVYRLQKESKIGRRDGQTSTKHVDSSLSADKKVDII